MPKLNNSRWLLCFIIIAVIHCALTITWTVKIGSYAGNLVVGTISKSFDGSSEPQKEIEKAQKEIKEYAAPWMPLAYALQFPTGYITKPLWKIVYQKTFFDKMHSEDVDPKIMIQKLKFISVSNMLINSLLFAMAWTLIPMGILRILESMHKKSL